MSTHPTIDETEPLLEQFKALSFYRTWLNSLPYPAKQDEVDYLVTHQKRLSSREVAWRQKRKAHMLEQSRIFLTEVEPIQREWYLLRPDLWEQLSALVQAYDVSCEAYVSVEFDQWKDSQPQVIAESIRKLIRDNR